MIANRTLLRAAIRALTRRPADDPLLELSGDIEGLPEDLTENFDRYLNERSSLKSPR